MKILILANNDLGLFRFRRELISELINDNDLFISLPYGEMVEPLKDMGCYFINTNVDRRGTNPIKDISLLIKYLSIISRCKPDLVITYTIKPNIYGGIACRIKKTQYVINITGLGTAFEQKGLLRSLVKSMYKTALSRAKIVFFENTTNRDLFVNEEIICSNKCHVLNGAGVNLSIFKYLDYPYNNVFHFLYVGRVMKEKGVDELFDSMERLIQNGYSCCLDVVGPFEEHYESIIHEYEAKGWLKYYGYQKDVIQFINACDCFVLPSYHEGMANTNLECAACGRPIITSNIPGCREAVTSESGLLCEPKDVNSLYDAMRTMIETKRSDRELMGKKGRELMEMSFSKTEVVAETIDSIMHSNH